MNALQWWIVAWAVGSLAFIYGIGWGRTGCHRWFLPCTHRTPQGGTVFAGLRREPPEYLPGLVRGASDGIRPNRTGELDDEWEQLDPDTAAAVLIAEWHNEANELRILPVQANAWHDNGWWDDPDLVVWDAKQQAARCWEILHVEFPRLRAELCGV